MKIWCRFVLSFNFTAVHGSQGEFLFLVMWPNHRSTCEFDAEQLASLLFLHPVSSQSKHVDLSMIQKRILHDHRRRALDSIPNCKPVPWTSITSKLDPLDCFSLDCWTVCLNGDFQAEYIIKPQKDTPWFYQPLFSSASDHNTLWGSLWEIQMSGRVKINSGSGETWVWLN